MTKFLVAYLGAGHPDPAEMEQARIAFGAWLAEAGSAVVDPGAPLRPAGSVGADADLVPVLGYSIVEAETADAASALLSSHPFVARGGTLQLLEAIAPPG
jgi:hypothetical protein